MDEILTTSRRKSRPCFVWGIDSRHKPSSPLGPGKVAATVAFDEIIAGLREPVASADAREIAAQLRALADTVRAGRDEWVVATARRAQRQARTHAVHPWWPWRGGV